MLADSTSPAHSSPSGLAGVVYALIESSARALAMRGCSPPSL